MKWNELFFFQYHIFLSIEKFIDKSLKKKTDKARLKKHIVSDDDSQKHFLFMKDSQEVIRMRVAQVNSNDIVVKQRRTKMLTHPLNAKI